LKYQLAKFYKIGFWYLILVSIFLLNFLKVRKINGENELKTINKLDDKRLSHLMISNNVLHRKLKPITGRNIITDQLDANLLSRQALLILLDQFKCDKCQEKELIRMNKLRNKIDTGRIKIIGLTTKTHKYEVLRQRKVTKIDFPIYVVEENTFNNLAIDKKQFPQIIFIDNQFILSGFLPISKDDQFSEKHFSDILLKIKTELK